MFSEAFIFNLVVGRGSLRLVAKMNFFLCFLFPRKVVADHTVPLYFTVNTEKCIQLLCLSHLDGKKLFYWNESYFPFKICMCIHISLISFELIICIQRQKNNNDWLTKLDFVSTHPFILTVQRFYVHNIILLLFMFDCTFNSFTKNLSLIAVLFFVLLLDGIAVGD